MRVESSTPRQLLEPPDRSLEAAVTLRQEKPGFRGKVAQEASQTTQVSERNDDRSSDRSEEHGPQHPPLCCSRQHHQQRCAHDSRNREYPTHEGVRLIPDRWRRPRRSCPEPVHTVRRNHTQDQRDADDQEAQTGRDQACSGSFRLVVADRSVWGGYGATFQMGSGASPRDSNAVGNHRDDESSDYFGDHISLQKIHAVVYGFLRLRPRARRSCRHCVMSEARLRPYYLSASAGPILIARRAGT